MSNVVARDGVKAEDIRLYRQMDVNGDGFAPLSSGIDDRVCRGFELESLDILEIMPWLVLQSAQEKARETVAAAEAEAERLRREATRESALAGRAQAMEELMPSLVAFADAGQSLIVFEEQLISRCAPQIVELALEIAEKVIGKAVDADAEIVASVLERAKREALDAKQLRICLNPADHRVLFELRPDLVKIASDGQRTIEVVATEEIARGGCRLETESGVIDATIPTQMDELRRQLLDTER